MLLKPKAAKPKKLAPLILAPLEKVELHELLPTLNPNFRPHVLSCGAGVDSLALLVEYIFNPDSRDFPLENLIVVHAVVGGESKETQRIMEEAIFPLCRRYNIWFIQVYRNGQYEEDGITVLSSTQQPTKFYLRGEFSLFTHSIVSGTVPQRGGSGRLCTLKFKSWVIDLLIQHLLGDSPRERFLGFNGDEIKRAKQEYQDNAPAYLVGFNADETSRLKDKSYGDFQAYDYTIAYNSDETFRIKECKERKQVFRFPLIEMGHGRQWCEHRLDAFLVKTTRGKITRGKKSFCVNLCPFSECNGKRQKGNNTHGDLREDWNREPKYGGEAAFVEHISLAMNGYQPLFTTKLVIDILQETNNQQAIAYYEELLEGQHWPELVVPVLRKITKVTKTRPEFQVQAIQAQADNLLQGKTWAVYCVRRIFALGIKQPFRQTRILFQGSQVESEAFLDELSDRYGKTPFVENLSYRFSTVQRPVVLNANRTISKTKKPPRPYAEESFVVAPASVHDKQRIEPSEFDVTLLHQP